MHLLQHWTNTVTATAATAAAVVLCDDGDCDVVRWLLSLLSLLLLLMLMMLLLPARCDSLLTYHFGACALPIMVRQPVPALVRAFN